MACCIGVGRYLHVVGVEEGFDMFSPTTQAALSFHRRRKRFARGVWGDSPSRFFFAFEVLFNEFCEVFNHKIGNILVSQRVGLFFFKE